LRQLEYWRRSPVTHTNRSRLSARICEVVEYRRFFVLRTAQPIFRPRFGVSNSCDTPRRYGQITGAERQMRLLDGGAVAGPYQSFRFSTKETNS
jgi:hypothetical protein